MIMHVDGNSFYASCERLFRPDLSKTAIAVLTNNDGIIIALNNECKALGFKRGDVYFKVRDKLETAGVAVFSSNYTLYADISARLNVIYNRFAPEVEMYSIDESFLFFPDWNNIDYSELAHTIKNTTQKEIGVPVSVGVAPTKTLAKMCNKLSKKSGGVFEWGKCDQKKTLTDYPVGDVWGIGRAKTELLQKQHVLTAYDLKNYPLEKAKKHLSIVGFRTVQELNGIPAIDRTVRDVRQGVMCSRSFSAPVLYFDEIVTALSEFTQEAVKRMREDRLACRFVTVFLMTSPYGEGEQYGNSATAALEKSSAYLPDILNAAVDLLQKIYRHGFNYRKVLVSLQGLEPETGQQLDLFDNNALTSKKAEIMKSFDAINQKYGRGAIRLGASALASEKTDDGRATWKMKREMLSPNYTTSFKDIPKVY